MVENVSSTTTNATPTTPEHTEQQRHSLKKVDLTFVSSATMSLEDNGVVGTLSVSTPTTDDPHNTIMGGPSNQDASTILKASSTVDRHSANLNNDDDDDIEEVVITSNSGLLNERMNGEVTTVTNNLSGSKLKDSLLEHKSPALNNFHSTGLVDVNSSLKKKLYEKTSSDSVIVQKTTPTTIATSPSKSILESFLSRPLKPNSVIFTTGTQQESLQTAVDKMDESQTSSKHHHHHHHHTHHHHHHQNQNHSPASPSEVVDTRKVEPLKINIHREPIKTVIKVPPQHQPSTPTKITIKPIAKPASESGEAPPPPSIPKLHIKNMSQSSFVISDDDEPPPTVTPAAEVATNVVPKLTIVRGPPPPTDVTSSTTSGHFIVASEATSSSGNAVPKITIKANHQNSIVNHTQDGGEPPQPTVPKLTLKAMPQLTPLLKADPQLVGTTSHHKDVRLTIKPIVEPPLPKILIKTNTSTSSFSQVEVPAQTATPSETPTIPKVTIKAIPKPLDQLPPVPHLTKVTIKPIVKPQPQLITTMAASEQQPQPLPKLIVKMTKDHDNGDEQLSVVSSEKPPPPIMPILHKLNIKPIVDPAAATATACVVQQKEKETVPKLSIKFSDIAAATSVLSPKKQQQKQPEADSSKETSPSTSSLLSVSANRLSLSNSSLNSTSISSSNDDDELESTRPVVIPKLTIKMVIADSKNPDETITETVVSPKVTLKPIPKPSLHQPLEIVTRTLSPAPPTPTESGQDSPRIILKINKTVQESRSGNNRQNITSELITVPSQPQVVVPVEKETKEKVVEAIEVSRLVVVAQPEAKPAKEVTLPPVVETVVIPDDEPVKERVPSPVSQSVIVPPLVALTPEMPSTVVVPQTIPVQQSSVETTEDTGPTPPKMSRQTEAETTVETTTPNNKRPADPTIVEADVPPEIVAPKRAKRLAGDETRPATPKQAPVTPAVDPENERSMRTRRLKTPATTPIVKPRGAAKQTPAKKVDDTRPGIVTRTKRTLKGDSTPSGSNRKKSENNNKTTVSPPTPQPRIMSNDTNKRMTAATKQSSSADAEQELLKQMTLAYGLTQQHINNGTAGSVPSFTEYENMIATVISTPVVETPPVKRPGRGRPRKIVKPPCIVPIEEDRDSTSSPMPQHMMMLGETKVTLRETKQPKCDTPNSVIEIFDDDDEEMNALETSKCVRQQPSMDVDPLAGTTPPPINFTSRDVDSNSASSSMGTPQGRGRGGFKNKGGRVNKPKIVEVMKNGKMVQIALEHKDDDDSPSFSLWNRHGKKGGRGRGAARGGNAGISFGASRSRWGQKALLLQQQQQTMSPEKFVPDSLFTTPANSAHKRKPFMHDLSSPPFFEEDTRMSSSDVFQTPIRITYDSMNNEESQSSQSGISMATTESSRKRGKMEVNNKDGKTEFTIDMLAEYEWPPPSDDRKSDVFMIQEQIAEYLGVKSFKRKYPDLVRRPVDMEERNYIMERGMASEKMCDLGLTALYASEILDIISNDYPEKYEEYKRYHREKFFRELSSRQRWKQMNEPIDRSQQQKDKAIESAANWNSDFNKERLENRRACMDLQTLTVQLPKTYRDRTEAAPSTSTASNYPVTLVPGQFSEYYRKYTPTELACYPINTALLDNRKLSEYLEMLKDKPQQLSDSDDDDDSDTDSGSSDSDSDSDTSSSSESSSDDDDSDGPRHNCSVCSLPQNRNPNNKPERFIKCTTCRQKGHPSCIGMSNRMLERVQEYKWQCSKCKTCLKCRKKVHPDKMLYCDQCDRGYHIYCIGLRNVPEGRWHCSVCSICTRCGSRSAEGHPNPNLTLQQRQNLLMMAHWTHQYRTNTASKIKEHCQTLCLLCARQQNL